VTPLYLIGFGGGTTAFTLLAARLIWRGTAGLASGPAAGPGAGPGGLPPTSSAVAAAAVAAAAVAAAAVTVAAVTVAAAGLATLLRRHPWRPAGAVLRLATVVTVTAAVPFAPSAAAVLAPSPPVTGGLLLLPLAVTVVGFEPCLSGILPGRVAARAVLAVTSLSLTAAGLEVLAMPRPGEPFRLAVGSWADRGVALTGAALLLTFVAGNLNAIERFATALAPALAAVPTRWWRVGALVTLAGAVMCGLVLRWHQAWLLSVPGVCTTALYLLAVRGGLRAASGLPPGPGRAAPPSCPLRGRSDQVD